jgi:hypothetical protein
LCRAAFGTHTYAGGQRRCSPFDNTLNRTFDNNFGDSERFQTINKMLVDTDARIEQFSHVCVEYWRHQNTAGCQF